VSIFDHNRPRLGLNRQGPTRFPAPDPAQGAPRPGSPPPPPSARAGANPLGFTRQPNALHASAPAQATAGNAPPPRPQAVAHGSSFTPSIAHTATRAPRIVIGVNALEAASGQGELITFGLGSCIAVILYDAVSRIGGMCHYMLADSRLDARRAQTDPLTFGDLAIPRLVSAFTARGGSLHGAETFLVGGASIASLSDIFDIGRRNAAMAKAMCERLGLHVRGEETGGRASRTTSLDLQTGVVLIQTPGLTPRRLR